MRKAFIVALIGALSTTPAAFAAPQTPSTSTATTRVTGPGSLRAAAIREARRAGQAPQPRTFQSTSERRPESGSWIRRHPALFGAVVGAGAGAIIAVSNTNELFCTGNDEDCLAYGASGVAFGAAVGAGVGMLAGHLVGKMWRRPAREAR